MVTSLSAVAEAAKDCRVLIWNVGKRVRDERLVLDLCGYSHRASGGVVRRTNHEPISDDWKSTEGDRGGCTMASKGGLSAQLVRDLERTMLRTMILQMQELQIGWTAARYILSVMKTRPSIGRLTVCAPELTRPVILCARSVVTKSFCGASEQIRRCGDFMSVTT